ncbi:unnamed protein product [marine sediment metagenome]|uniref:Uncharacterized protein n=1 Tax=marine sediment metagenome TaxID=412755 RepID=X1EPP0_9ZZZZ
MICPYCGEELKDTTQEFCESCGSKIATDSEVSTPHATPISPKKLEKITGPAGPLSKRSLVFGIASVTIAVANYFLFFVFYIIFGMIGLTLQIVVLLLGVILGISSRKNSNKAGRLEPKNNLEKVGSVFSIIGAIINGIWLFIMTGYFIVFYLI